MLKVKDIMSKEVITLSPDTEVAHAAKLLLEKRINGAPVVDEAGSLVGILCQSDLVTQQKSLPLPSIFTFLDGFVRITSLKQLDRDVQKIAAITVAHAMTPDPFTVRPETSIEDIANLMVDKSFHTLPVVDDGKLVGIVGKADILKTLTSGS
jgi:CBS-domain-containing membrane protein